MPVSSPTRHRKGRATFGSFHLWRIEGRDCRRLEPLTMSQPPE